MNPEKDYSISVTGFKSKDSCEVNGVMRHGLDEGVLRVFTSDGEELALNLTTIESYTTGPLV